MYADGPRRPEDVVGVRAARAEARRLLGDQATFVERETNLGMQDSLIACVTQLCDRYGRVVVIEEDLELAPSFLRFMNLGLARYERELRVMQVCGYMFDVPQFRDRDEAILLPMTNSLGWATWKRAWDKFDPEATRWQQLLRDPGERRRFNLDGHFPYAKMLAHHMRSKRPAWDIRWYYSVFSADGLALYPPRTLVVHTGFDGSGSHDRFSLPVHQAELELNAEFAFPDAVIESPDKTWVFEAIERFRPASTFRKAMALATYVLRRAGVGNRPVENQTASSDDRTQGDGTPAGGDR